MIPLTHLHNGAIVSIICLGCAMDQACRLREMGCSEGVTVRVLSSRKNILLQIGETRLAINRQLARMILVNPSDMT